VAATGGLPWRLFHCWRCGLETSGSLARILVDAPRCGLKESGSSRSRALAVAVRGRFCNGGLPPTRASNDAAIALSSLGARDRPTACAIPGPAVESLFSILSSFLFSVSSVSDRHLPAHQFIHSFIKSSPYRIPLLSPTQASVHGSIVRVSHWPSLHPTPCKIAMRTRTTSRESSLLSLPLV
jgi:hypothetical protein